ncbi:MAG: hypothetical protein Rubg2KO_27810 [Rubricoccaceae bacterium]
MFQAFRQRVAERRHQRQLAAISLASARIRAARGAAFLDDADPGWAARIDPGRLELADGASCVLGQLHGGYRLGLGRARILNLSSAPLASASPVELGSQAVQGLGDDIEDLDYAFLTRAWRECLEARVVASAIRAPRSVATPTPE